MGEAAEPEAGELRWLKRMPGRCRWVNALKCIECIGCACGEPIVQFIWRIGSAHRTTFRHCGRSHRNGGPSVHPTNVGRKGGEVPIATGRRRSGKRLLTVGTDCCVGKKYSALSLHKALQERGIAATFRATGQTGILIAGRGIPMDLSLIHI